MTIIVMHGESMGGHWISGFSMDTKGFVGYLTMREMLCLAHLLKGVPVYMGFVHTGIHGFCAVKVRKVTRFNSNAGILRTCRLVWSYQYA